MTVPGEITASLRAMVEGFLERVLYLAVALIRIGDQIVLVDFIVDALRALRPRDGAAAGPPGD